MLAALALVAIAAPLIAPHDPEAIEVRRVLGAAGTGCIRSAPTCSAATC